MTIEKQIVVDQIEVTSEGCVQVRTATNVMENGSLIARSFHRHVIVPGQDFSGEDEKVQAICSAAHTPEVIAAFQDAAKQIA